MKKIEKIVKAVQSVNGWEHLADMGQMFPDTNWVSSEDLNKGAARLADFVLTKWAKTAQDYWDTFELDSQLHLGVGHKYINDISEIVENEIQKFDLKQHILKNAAIEEKINLDYIHEIYIRVFVTLKLNEILGLLEGLELDDDDLEELQKEARY